MRDYRRVLERQDIDAVIVGTPDHWHALATIESCMAGKDVYCEKPLATTIAEGRAMVNAARRYDRVVQVGTQQRSTPHFDDAIEFLRSGQLGKIRTVTVWAYLDWKAEIPPVPDEPARDGRLRHVARPGAASGRSTAPASTSPSAGTGTTPAG